VKPFCGFTKFLQNGVICDLGEGVIEGRL
ncbi:uncharacterized protein METZ01_LOCUS411797, partial [marine metagenome]